ncbi:MAG: F0F1 ATP synthase subunit B, partial [Flavobacteriaceae bacterium]|nr:F0F1 ATP synthase subunit B [Flavobacteriaceae bacterium]
MLTPEIGLIFWTTIAFGVLFFVLSKYAWNPILKSVNDRESSIKDALDEAEKARLEMQNLQADNERILKEARAEREAMLKEARELKSKMIADAKDEAQSQASKMIEQAQTAIES